MGGAEHSSASQCLTVAARLHHVKHLLSFTICARARGHTHDDREGQAQPLAGVAL
jgi:hypothetical protein